MDELTKMFHMNKERFTARDGGEGPDPSLLWLTARLDSALQDATRHAEFFYCASTEKAKASGGH